MTTREPADAWRMVSSASQWVGTPSALVSVRETCSEIDAKEKIIFAIENDLVRLSSPLIIHEGDVGEPYPNLDFWMNDKFFHRFEGQQETCWVKVSDKRLIQLPKGTLAVDQGWRVCRDRISWARGDFVTIRPERRSSSRLKVSHPQENHQVGLSVNTEAPMIRRYVAELHFAREDLKIFRDLNPLPTTIARAEVAKIEPQTPLSVSPGTYDWSDALYELDCRIQSGTMSEIFGPLLGPNLTQKVATFLHDRTSDSNGRKPAMRTARTYAQRVIEQWRKAEANFKR